MVLVGSKLDIVVKLVEFFVKVSNLIDLFEIFEFPKISELIFEGGVPDKGPFFVIFFLFSGVQMLSYLMKVILASVRNFYIGIFFVVLARLSLILP